MRSWIPLLVLLLSLLSLQITSGAEQEAGEQAIGIGVCYGTVAYDQPSPQEAVSLVQSLGIKRMRIYGPDHNVLQSLRNSGIEVVLGVPHEQIDWLGSSQDNANQWIQDNVKNYQDISFRYIVVGDPMNGTSVLEAMQNIQNAISASGLENKPRVTTSIDQSRLAKSYPPSQGEFNELYTMFLNPIITFLVNNNSPLLVTLNPLASYVQELGTTDDIPQELRLQAIHDPRDARMDYASFKSSQTVVQDGPLTYTNVFDAKVDSVYSALEKAGGSRLDVVSETGWPTGGGYAANIENAWNYNNGLINHLLKTGTPKRPQKRVETYILNLFDETSKNNYPDTNKHWGIFWNSKQPKYQINFQTR